MFATIDIDIITESWARAQHDQYELGLDFIDKLIETYGAVEYKTSDGKKKKMSMKKRVVRDLNKPTSSSGESVDDDARKEALAILGLADSDNGGGGQAPKNAEPKPIAEEVADSSLDEEDEAIKRLLESGDSQGDDMLEEQPNPVRKVKLKSKDAKESSNPKKIALKPKGKIVLGSKPKEKIADSTPVKKPKIVIKKK